MLGFEHVADVVEMEIQEGRENEEIIIRWEKSDKLLYRGAVQELAGKVELLTKKVDSLAVLHGTTTVIIIKNI